MNEGTPRGPAIKAMKGVVVVSVNVGQTATNTNTNATTHTPQYTPQGSATNRLKVMI